MCILFLYNGANEIQSDYSLILASNRDEYYDRPAQRMAPWSENPNIYGGRDLESGCGSGTWLAVNPHHKRIGLLLNLPGKIKENAKSRGSIVADYVKNELTASEYIASIKSHSMDCNEFIFVSVEFRNSSPEIKTYNNATNETRTWPGTCLGFGNSLPENPLRKVVTGKTKLRDICSNYNKTNMKEKLIVELVKLLKNEEKQLPDEQLQKRQPDKYKELSSIFVSIPEAKYGTRAHTLILITKSGQADLIEISMESPINVEDPQWKVTEFKLQL